MYENFKLKNKENITAYLWDVEDPKKVMCIIHGIGEHAGRYDRMCSFLQENGIASVAIDLPGHGRSLGKRGHAAPRYEVLDDVSEMINFAGEKYPGIPITLYGHSMGGNICIDYKSRGDKNHIPEKYIMSAPWITLVRPVTGIQYAAVKALSKLLPQKTVCSACPKELLGHPSNLIEYVNDQYIHDRVSLQTAVEGFDIGNGIFDGSFKSDGKADRTPTLLMHGDADGICSVEGSRRVAERNKDNDKFEYVEWEGYFHEIHNGGEIETGEKVIEKIKDYILE